MKRSRARARTTTARGVLGLTAIALLVGCGSGDESGSATTSSAVAVPAVPTTQAPETTGAPTTQAPTPTSPPTTEAPVETAPPATEPAAEPAGLATLCAVVVHRPVEDTESGFAALRASPQPTSLSGIWVRGEVYGLDGGWIWVEGPTLNGGQPIGIEVAGGEFEAGLGINSFGDHEMTVFELVPGPGVPPGSADAIDLLPQLQPEPGAVFTVGPQEGPLFDSECTDLQPGG